jgi:hypothetical protein
MRRVRWRVGDGIGVVLVVRVGEVFDRVLRRSAGAGLWDTHAGVGAETVAGAGVEGRCGRERLRHGDLRLVAVAARVADEEFVVVIVASGV